MPVSSRGPIRVRLLLLIPLLLLGQKTFGQTERLLGLDVSAWQGNISQTTWNNIRNVENRQFVVIRSSRGGTTGYYNQNDAANNNGQNTLSQRYDDPYYIQNVNRASTAGMYVGSYHFSRPDIIETTLNSGGIRNNGTDEADHFIQMAGPWMRPGYLVPVHDLEAGINQRTSDEMAQFCIEFSDRIYEKMGIRPAIYINGSYAADLQAATAPYPDLIAKPAALQPSVVSPAYPVLWSARWPNQADPNSIDVQNGEPKDSYTPIYGPWDNYGTTHPWVFWQYASTLRLQSFQSGGANLDADVVRGGVEFLKDALVPAVWMHDGGGSWNTLTNWNSGQTPVQPVPGTNQVTPVATGPLPTPRLPSTNDTVILERPNADITVTVSGTPFIRKLYARETLVITSNGVFNVLYTPSPDSTPHSAQFSAPVYLTNAALNVHTLQVDSNQTFTVAGLIKFSKIVLMPGDSPAKIALSGNSTFDSWSNTVCSIVSGSGNGSVGRFDLGGGNRTIAIPTADLTIDVPVENGGLAKNQSGTLRLTQANTYAGGTSVSGGKLYVNNLTGSGTGSGSVTVNTSGTLGGLGIISGATTITGPGSIAPGTETTLGTLTFNSSLVLNGNSIFRVDRNGGSPASDRIARPGGSLAYAGFLVVSNSGAPLTGGEVFTLFSATSYSGAFSGTNLPGLGAGLNWYLGGLTVDGSIAVNRKPVVSFVALDNTPGQMLAISISSLLASGTDADGDTLALSSFDFTTTNGVPLSSDGTNIYYFNNADVPDQFNYTLSDGRGGSASGVVLIGQGVPTSPSIVAGPTNQTVLAGQNATFSVTASGTSPLFYQWRFNGTNIAGATVSSYTRSNVQSAHQGNYSVVVTNAYGSITSPAASLTVVTPPSIVLGPQSASVSVGQAASFSVTASGTAPLRYQWRFQGNPISGATSSSFVLGNVTSNDFGGYSVIVTNDYGSAVSAVAILSQAPLQVLWQLAPYSRPYLTTNDLPEQRGMTFNRSTGRLLIVHRTTTTVYVLDENGVNLWTLNTNNVTGGLSTSYHLLLIGAADDGAIYASNLKASSTPFKIYRWANDSSNTVPTVAFSGDPSPGTPGYRWGDTFDVRGSGTNTQILIGPRQGTNVVLFTTTNGLDFTPRVINLTDIPSGHCGLNVTFGQGNTFWGTSHTNLLRLVAFDPAAGTASTIRTYLDSEVPTAINPIGFSPGLNMLAGIHVNSPNHLRVYDFSPTNGVPYLIGSTNFPTDNSNTHTGTGAVRFGDDVIYALDANNGLMAVRVLLPASGLRFDEFVIQPSLLTFRGRGPVGNYIVEATSTSFTNWTPVGNVAIGINGTFEFTESVTNGAHRFYRVRKQ